MLREEVSLEAGNKWTLEPYGRGENGLRGKRVTLGDVLAFVLVQLLYGTALGTTPMIQARLGSVVTKLPCG